MHFNLREHSPPLQPKIITISLNVLDNLLFASMAATHSRRFQHPGGRGADRNQFAVLHVLLLVALHDSRMAVTACSSGPLRQRIQMVRGLMKKPKYLHSPSALNSYDPPKQSSGTRVSCPTMTVMVLEPDRRTRWIQVYKNLEEGRLIRAAARPRRGGRHDAEHGRRAPTRRRCG